MAALNPASLHHYAIGPLIASEDCKWHVKSKRKDGTVTREEAEKSISDSQKIRRFTFNSTQIKSLQYVNLLVSASK